MDLTFGWIALIVVIILVWSLLLCLMSLFMGLIGVVYGFRKIKPHLPLMIWGAISTKHKELKNKSVLNLAFDVIKQSIYGTAGGRPRKDSSPTGSKLGGIMAMIEEAQALVQASQVPK